MKKNKYYINYILKIAEISKIKIIVSLLFSILGTILTLLITIYFKSIIDSFSTGMINKLQILKIILCLIFSLFFSSLSEYLFGNIGYIGIKNLRDKLWEHISHLPASFFQKNDNNVIATHLTNDTSQITNLISTTLPNGINSIIMILGSFFMLIKLDFKLTLIFLVFIPIILIILLPIINKLRILSEQLQSKNANLNSLIAKFCRGNIILKLFLLSKKSIISEQKMTRNIFIDSNKQLILTSIVNPIISISFMLMFFAIIIIGSADVSKKVITVGTLAVYLMYVVQITNPVMNMFSLLTNLKKTQGSISTIYDYLIENTEKIKKGKFLDSINEINIKKIFFKYKGQNNYVIKNLSLHCQTGDSIAILGESGVGKTTLINCILGLFNVNDGEILFNNSSLPYWSPYSVRKRISYVSQNNVFLPGNIKDNVSSENEYKNFLNYINIFGLNSRIKNNYIDYNKQLSGGQAQRLSIARALSKDYDLLVLDECFSSLDSKSSYKIQQYIMKNNKDKIIIDVTHKLEEARKFDYIYKLVNGNLIRLK